MPTKILISACLLGEPVRYDGAAKQIDHALLQRWQSENRLIKLCPEQAGGLQTPRAPAEIQHGDGLAVLAGKASVINTDSTDVSNAFIQGAQAALSLARQYDIKFALLKAKSPSCGNETIYNGQFNGHLKNGPGVTAALLQQHGIKVFNETEIEALSDALTLLESN